MPGNMQAFKEPRKLVRKKFQAWSRDAPIDDRDRALINATRLPWLHYDQQSYLIKVFHMKRGKKTFDQGLWTVENENACKSLVESAGATLVGYGDKPATPVDYACMTVCVKITGQKDSGFEWGYLATQPEHIRIFKGPQFTCSLHPWDAAILRDCIANTTTLDAIPGIAGRKWDILVVKMCENYDSPWIVFAMKDAGPASDKPRRPCGDAEGCGCQMPDPTCECTADNCPFHADGLLQQMFDAALAAGRMCTPPGAPPILPGTKLADVMPAALENPFGLPVQPRVRMCG